ncbi:MAG: hypothetical protein LBU62_02095 [Bacteroidales bacterium]|jgi:nitrogen regulatory protein PII|nr:hypothetical protein [Bacteroidales bacterium]
MQLPIVSIDSSLNEYDNIVVFPDKLEKANEMLRKVGLPKQWTSLTLSGRGNADSLRVICVQNSGFRFETRNPKLKTRNPKLFMSI